MKIVLPALYIAVLAASARAQPPFVAALEREGVEAVSGAVLVSELACTACHGTGQEELAAKPGPDLSAVGARVNGAHLRRFIAAPSRVKPGTTMPDVLAHLPDDQREETADALAHYLASLGQPAATTPPQPDAVERGAKLYHSVGCVACHAPATEVPGSVPLGPLAEKYTVASLTAFLERPLDVRPGGRMPDGHLERGEAEDIASYLLRGQQTPLEAFATDSALAARGKALFTEHRCHACHTTGEKLAPPSLTAFGDLHLDDGCLTNRSGAWPHYPLTETQRGALRAAIADERRTWTPAEQVQLALTRLNCLACHERDGLGGIVTERNAYFTGREESLGEQGRLPPPLTGVGAKLKAPWLREVIANGAGVRTTMNTRMPKFGAANAEPLVALFRHLDPRPPAQFERVPPSAKPEEIGRELAGAKGLNCIACHAFRGRSIAIRGLELTTLTERLEEDWFHRFLAQPQRFAPLTVMPNFWPDGISALPGVLGGDPGRQRDALWQFLERGPEAGEPAGLVLERLVVEVADEAVIIRRAFPGIGKRGIGVGYPGGINLAFDAQQMRLASVWSGGFIEASGLWRGQGAGQAHLLGQDTVEFPPGPAFARLAAPDAAWPAPDPEPRPSPFSFKGYVLDAQQRPTFRYALEGFIVEDFFIERRDPAGRLFFERTLKFPAPPPANLHFRIAVDESIEPVGANDFAVGQRLKVRLTAPGTVRNAGPAKELLLPVVGGELRLEYHLTAKP